MAESWAYYDANTIQVTGDLTAKYGANQLVKITQGGAIKFFMITAVALVSGNTRLSVNGCGTYTLTNETISSPAMTTNAAPPGLPFAFTCHGTANHEIGGKDQIFGLARISIAPDGTLFAIASSDRSLQRYDAPNWTRIGGVCMCVTALSSGEAYVMGTDLNIYKWTTAGGFAVHAALP